MCCEALSLQFSESHAFIAPAAGLDSFLNGLLHLICAEAIFIDLPWFEFFGEGVGCAKLDRSLLSLKLAGRHRKRWNSRSPFQRIFLILGADVFLRLVELHVDAKDLLEACLREDLVPFGIHNF